MPHASKPSALALGLSALHAEDAMAGGLCLPCLSSSKSFRERLSLLKCCLPLVLRPYATADSRLATREQPSSRPFSH